MAIAIGLMGCAHIHVPAFVRMLKGRTDVNLVRVWDHDADRARMRAMELRAEQTADWREIVADPAIAAVIVASETDRHAMVVPEIVRAGKHVFVEKPLGFGASDALAMAEAIEAAGVKFQTGYFMRGWPVMQFLKRQVEAGGFGKVTRVRASNCHRGALAGWFDREWRWMADPAIAGCGAFGDLGTHALDLLLWMFGSVAAVTGQIDAGTGRYPGCDETGEALLRFKSGVIGTLAAGWDDLANPVTFLISGTEGHAVVIRDELFFTSSRVEGADGKAAWTGLPPAWPHAFELFLNALVGKPAELVTAREAAYRNVVMEAIYRGAREGKWVQVV
jgi:predicted dehydrogenase